MCLYCIYNYIKYHIMDLKNNKIFIISVIFTLGVLLTLFIDAVVDTLINLTNND